MTTMVMVIFALSPPICLIFGVITLSTDLQASLTGASIDSCDCLSAVQLTVAVDLTTHVELFKGNATSLVEILHRNSIKSQYYNILIIHNSTVKVLTVWFRIFTVAGQLGN